MEIFSTDIKDKKEFNFDGSRLKFVKYYPETNQYLYERFYQEGRRMGWELVTPKKKKQPDGSCVEVYPSTEGFGRYGLFFPPRYTIEDINNKVKNYKK